MGFIVTVLGTHCVVFQSDNEWEAVRFCMESKRPCTVTRTSDGELICYNA